MKYKLINPVNSQYSTQQQVLTNRGIPLEDINHYMNTTDNDINDFMLLGVDLLKSAATQLITAIDRGSRAVIVVDADDDGYTSAAILINYLHHFFPTWIENNLSWYMHKGKQHGLNDCIDWILEEKPQLVIVPDGGSNDFQEHKILKDHHIPVIIFDHHEIDYISSDAIVINIQLNDYPNKELSGAGVTWQFCRYLDSLLDSDYANHFLDLVALGLTGDMMSLRSMETHHLIQKGFQPENIHNPFIYYMWQKNQFKLGDHITSWGAAFYIVPFVNAIVRSGTQKEKELVFKSMLDFKAFEQVPSTKRGHLLGETETIVEQAIRLCNNVKNRQTKAQDSSIQLLEDKIQQESLLDNKVLLFLLEPGQIDRNIAGLAANKMMGKYQRPCCVLTRNGDVYEGSARGCDKVGITEFKDICTETGIPTYTAGHQGAFGLGLRESDIKDFISATNEALKDMSTEILYYVDYVYNGDKVNPQNILDIADMNDFWGKDIDEALIAIENLKVTKDMVRLMSPDKNPTLKITLPNHVAIIKFSSSQEEYEKFITEGFVKVNIVGKCAINEWNDTITPQILVEDYEITSVVKYLF